MRCNVIPTYPPRCCAGRTTPSQKNNKPTTAPSRAAANSRIFRSGAASSEVKTTDDLEANDVMRPIHERMPVMLMHLAERGLLGVRELPSTFQLGLQDAVFGDQIFVLRQQFLVHRPRDIGQHARPIHNGSPFADRPRRRSPQNVPDWPPEPLHCGG